MKAKKQEFTSTLSLLVYTGLLGVVFACASSEKKVSDIVAEPLPTNTPSEQISTLESQITQAKQSGVDVLSPTWYNSSVKSLNRAKEIRRDGGNHEEMLSHLADGRAQISRAKNNSQIAAHFRPDEADFFEQDDKLVLRLKSLNFQSGQSQLGQQNFALLEKVQRVLSDFPKASVTVEGHTDSTGSVAANNKISQARADAVKEYLSSKRGVENEHLSAIGLGSQKPIASNQTSSGRAENRRIDLVISTGEASLAE